MPVTMTADDACNVLSLAEDDPPDVLDAVSLRTAGLALVEETRRLEREVQRWRALAQAEGRRSGRPVVEGAELVEEVDAGGRRHYLDGAPVHAGQPLCLLTHDGWLAGRYESRRSAGGGLAGVFHFRLPGVWDDAGIPIPSRARLAWPEQLGR